MQRCPVQWYGGKGRCPPIAAQGQIALEQKLEADWLIKGWQDRQISKKLYHII